MEEKNKSAIKEYQCSGCFRCCNDLDGFIKSSDGIGCGNHSAATIMCGGPIYLGLPKGFNRLGLFKDMSINIFNDYDSCSWQFDKFNIPVWKHLNEKGHTIVRGMMPRLNEPIIHIFLEDCMDKIYCLEITKEDISNMD